MKSFITILVSIFILSCSSTEKESKEKYIEALIESEDEQKVLQARELLEETLIGNPYDIKAVKLLFRLNKKRNGNLSAYKDHLPLIDDEPAIWSWCLPGELRFSTPGKQLTDNYSKIHAAAYEGNQAIVEKLLKEGVSPNKPARWGSTPLHFAAVSGKTKICEFLLQSGAKINLENRSQDTPLDLALHIDNPNVTQLLLEHGAKKGHRITN